ncbi:MAG TPA: hypothetical protein VF659_05735 [Pyrinomonadaceae bacterium]|jgi:hypothetical protein
MTLKLKRRALLGALAGALLLLAPPAAASAQAWPKILEGDELTRVVPSSFYFEGQSAPTQMRNAAAVQLGPARFTMAGLVDTSGYSSEVQAKYVGFIITDSPVTVGGARLPTGAYGFGFNGGWLNVMDVGGRRILSVRTRRDADIQRPRPLMMTEARNGVRLYAGREWVLISSR